MRPLPQMVLLCTFASTALLAGCDRRDERADADPYAARLAHPLPPRPAHTPAAVAATADRDSAVLPQFTTLQAARGAEVYTGTCARCHAVAQWTGGTFAAGWQGRRLSDFYELVATTMPQDTPGSLSEEQYVDVTAYVLQLGGFTSGDVALRADTAVTRHARLTMPVTVSSH